MLREPVNRVISHYYYIRTRDHLVTYETANELDLEAYVRRPDEHDCSNIVTKILCGAFSEVNAYGLFPGDYGSGIPEEQWLGAAKKNLCECFLFGIVEQFDESLARFCRLFGWPSEPYVSKRVNPYRPELCDISSSALMAIRKKNLLDIELYEYAVGLFEERGNDE